MCQTITSMKEELKIFQYIFKSIIKLNESEKRTIFNIDFNMVFKYVWNSDPMDGTPPYKNYGLNFINTLINNQGNLNSKFDSYFTLPSYLELLDSFNHHVKYIDKYRMNSNFFNGYDEAKFDRILKVQENITQNVTDQELNTFLKLTDTYSIKSSLERAKKLIGKDGIFLGQGDILKEKLNFSKSHLNQFNKLFNTMKSKRSYSDGRNQEDREFHYKIDTANILTTMEIAALNQFNSKFITTPKLVHTFCRNEGTGVQVPFLWMTSLLVSDKNSNYYGDYEDILADALDLINSLLKKLNKASTNNLRDLPNSYFYTQDILFDTYLKPLHHPELLNNISSMDKNKKIRHTTFESYMDLQSKLDESRTEVTDLVSDFQKETQFILTEEELKDYSLEEDPVLKEIRKNFGL